MSADVLGLRALNRTTLHRQLLLGREARTAADVVGLQAQEPPDPYVALWSRLEAFRPAELAALMEDRSVVRIVVMRGTIHLVTAGDALTLRPLMQPVMDAEIRRHRDFAPELEGVDIAPVLAFAAKLLGDEPLTPARLRTALGERFPDLHAGALAYACRCYLALVQVPPRGLWGRTGGVTLATVESWIGRPLDARPSLDEVVLRYLAAFGPATVADVAAWSRLTGLRPVLERLRPRLRVLADERGRELFDVPDAGYPDPDTPAPPRFLPVYDNALLSHADRTRVLPEETRTRLHGADRAARGSVLYDGFAIGTWSVDRDGESVVLVVHHDGQLTRAARQAIAAEGAALLDLLPDGDGITDRDVRFIPLP
jgi:hypothetical protein